MPPEPPLPPEVSGQLEPAPPPVEAPSRAPLALIATVTFFLTFVAYIAGQLLVIANIPFALLVTSLLVFGAAGLLFAAAFNLNPLRFVGLQRVPWTFVGLAAMVGAANFGVANFLMGLSQLLLPPDWSEQAEALTRLLLGADPAARVVLIVAAGVAAPLGEETFFRGWMQGLASQRMSAFLSAFWIGILFSFVHLDPVGFVARVELGLLFGLLRAWTGSLWPAITMHATHNLLSLAVLYLAKDPLAELGQPFPWQESALLAAFSLAATGSILAWMMRRGPPVPVDVAPHAPGVPPLTFHPEPALRYFYALVAAVLVSGTLIVLFGSRLPGGGLQIPQTSIPSDLPAAPGLGPE